MTNSDGQRRQAIGRPTVVGIDVGGTSTKAAVVTPDGKVVARAERPTDVHAGTKTIIAVAEDLLSRAKDFEVQISAVGVGAAGFVDAATGSITFSPNLTYDDPHIADALKTRVGLPVIVDNDANAAAWGERAFGCAQGCDDVSLVTLGTGIGSGFVVEGRLVRGATGAGAELGHTIVDPHGPQCGCGLRGCLEQLASGTAIARMAREAMASDPDSLILALAGSVGAIRSEHVSEAATKDDETARAVLRLAGRSLGIGLSNVVNLFDPQVIVLGGGLVQVGEPYLGPARDQLFRMTTEQHRRPKRLDVTALGHDAGILGAAALAFDLAGAA
jgi:glucokinase